MHLTATHNFTHLINFKCVHVKMRANLVQIYSIVKVVEDPLLFPCANNQNKGCQCSLRYELLTFRQRSASSSTAISTKKKGTAYRMKFINVTWRRNIED